MSREFFPDYKTLGLTVPVTECLDPRLWRLRYAVGTNAGQVPSARADTSTAAGQACVFGGTLYQALETERGQEDAALLGQLVAGLPDTTIRWHLRAALSELEMRLSMPLAVEIVKSLPVDEGLVQGVHFDRVRQRLPYRKSDMANWWRFEVPEAFVVSVERVRAFYYGTAVWEFVSGSQPGELVERTASDNTIRLEWGKQGIGHLLPLTNTAFLYNKDGGSAYLGLWDVIAQHRTAIPDFWAIDYTVGPITRSGQIGRIEAVLADWVYAVAGVKLLSMAGLAQSRGLTSASVSMDGVSQSIGLQASAIYGLNSALEQVLEKQAKRIDWNKLRAWKRGPIVLGYQ